ncbi:MAG: hypothetical protein DCC67_11385 [Planctomycetota bacterium]|nr:MAG: hypothetical protein DCC67_11385 [Planctomycetota bacterium]
MKPRLVEKLAALRDNLNCGHFILADAKDADMAWGVASPGHAYPPRQGDPGAAAGAALRQRSMAEFREQIREIVRQGAVDIMLASAATMDVLAHREQIFDASDVTPAVRVNDATDVWLPRGGVYRESPSRPFASCYLEEVQFGNLHGRTTMQQAHEAFAKFGRFVRASGEHLDEPVVNLGLYSATFNNCLESDLATLAAFREFRAYAQKRKFRYFLEVFAPNVKNAVAEEQIPAFVNDSICRMLAGVPLNSRPEFLKVPYFGPEALEELVAYDTSMLVGVLGGSSGTSFDAFTLLAEAKKHGARVALFGRKIKDAEHPLSFVALLRRVADGEIGPQEAVRAYHGELAKHNVPPRRSLEDDLQLTATELSYAR